VRISLLYSGFETDVGFLRHKPKALFENRIWLYAFFTHALLSMLVLLAGFTQFSRLLMRKYPRVHRRVGQLYCFNIIFIVAPTGFVMGLYASGGWLGRSAFCTLAVLWWLTTFMAYIAAKRRQFKQHQYWIIYSFALTLSAITFRIILTYMRTHANMPPMQTYGLASWLGFLPNVLVAFFIIQYIERKSMYKQKRSFYD
jgi:Na+-driven multidrug efflux pump